MRLVVNTNATRLLATALFLGVLLISFGSNAFAQERPINWCGTQQIFEEKYKDDSRYFDPNACPSQGTCDDPAERDSWIPVGGEDIVYIRLFFHVFAESDGTNAAATPEDVDSQVVQLNEDYLPHNVQFVYDMETINSTQFRYMTSSSEFNTMKNAHNVTPYEVCNIWVTDVNIGGSVYSFATFPWDGDALSATGGIVMNDSQFWPSDGRTLTHEMGHCLGLWHTFHGVDEVGSCGPCYESPNGVDNDYRGDFCSDTDPTPTNYSCSPPGGTDPCSSEPWGETDTQNYMGYSPSTCYEEFSPQQSGRINCWLRDRLISWAIPLFWSSDVALGEAPLTVNFEAQSPRTVSVWQWQFGNGDTSPEEDPTYEYLDPGHYDVSITLVTPQGNVDSTIEKMVSVYADTLSVESVQGAPGADVGLDVSLRNFLEVNEIEIPFTWAGPLNVVYDSFSTAGLRTNYFESQTQANYDFFNNRATVRLKASSQGTSPYLAPGTGPVVTLWFSVPAAASGGPNPIVLTDYTVFHPELTTYAGTYNASRVDGAITTSCCTGPSVGNVDGSPDNLITMGDLTVLIDYLFITLSPLDCDDEGNLDMSVDGLITMADLTVMIDHLFITLTPLPACP